MKRNSERSPHPNGQDAFTMSIRFPWHRDNLCRIKVEITHDEMIILPPQKKPILHEYDEPIDCSLQCYHIEEIVAEKLRALLQTHKKLVTRGWNKPRARDYYDLWSILKHYKHAIKSTRLLEMLNKKCAYREVGYQSIDDFFTPELMREAHDHWEKTLGTFVEILPDCGLVLNETRRLIEVNIFLV